MKLRFILNKNFEMEIVGLCKLWYTTDMRSNRVQSGSSQTRDRGEVVLMDMYEVLSLLFLGGSFLIALLAYIDRNNKRK